MAYWRGKWPGTSSCVFLTLCFFNFSCSELLQCFSQIPFVSHLEHQIWADNFLFLSEAGDSFPSLIKHLSVWLWSGKYDNVETNLPIDLSIGSMIFLSHFKLIVILYGKLCLWPLSAIMQPGITLYHYHVCVCSPRLPPIISKGDAITLGGLVRVRVNSSAAECARHMCNPGLSPHTASLLSWTQTGRRTGASSPRSPLSDCVCLLSRRRPHAEYLHDPTLNALRRSVDEAGK